MSSPTPFPRVLLASAGRGLTLAAAVLLAGCASSRQSTEPPTTAAADDPLVDSLAASYAQDMNDLASARPTATRAGSPVPGNTGIFIEPVAPEPAPTTPIASADPAPAETDAATPAPPAAASQPDVAAMARELAAALRRRAIEGVSPYEDLSRVAMLEGIAPGVLEGLGEDAASDSSDLVAILAPSERDALRAARRTARALAESDAADPALAADALRAAAESLDQSQDIRITAAALCTRVDGFARYQTFDSSTFLAGRSNPMIVYAQVDRFRQRPVGSGTQAGAATSQAGPVSLAASTPGAAAAGSPSGTPGARFVVTLTQSLNLYFADGGLLVWRRPPQTITDYSAARFRDFYIIDTIELPPTLAAGAYSLKVIVRDEATGQQTESIIPITLVADAGLAQGG